MADINHHRIAVHDHISPHMAVKLLFGKNLPRMVQKQLHHDIFLAAQGDFHSVFFQAHGIAVIYKGAGHLSLRILLNGFVAADEGFDFRAQHHRIEGLGNIIIRPQLQPVKGIVLLGAGAEDHDGDIILFLPQLLHHREAVHSSQHDIQQHQIKGFSVAQQCQSLFAAGSGFRLQPDTLHHPGEYLADSGFIVYDQYPFLRHGDSSLGSNDNNVIVSYKGMGCTEKTMRQQKGGGKILKQRKILQRPDVL